MIINKKEKRQLRHNRVRARLSGTKERPRLSAFKSSKYIYAQLIDDKKGETLVSASNANEKSKLTALSVGEEIGKKALDKKIKEVVFDKGGFKYHGQIKELADGARKAGLKF
ncbi:50S ribosomal protein L18 [bacterium CG_4_10_14_0_2_um_filter_33_32]|nr:MAG: 50S ribosomal protein L18 [bacterium CG2_30_33_46]PIR67375.1 MAG: 50S ribosomal protein L18 [bacterium CG10_big_fil_rev_8_21_14_0_10_33_18]PIU76762.1 MAG: 50S ribosomal protein L18 [bacterium CG06_land_8_20_14_3_00_33_50]PIW81292.1 MAG: 50S ribosomal protein L18 [bacterium CG_4_8_14_3_um_filter_33_28]PIY85719.1 MAG: 50S ribosomal protein L18 [bacterium CG_4_10_14_0_8_um_filter_33_57]PIZ86578.1 MAG: 50S ribosomal protein L18 [bacterium CG_4_10_14_0_2_um_filter_33_32]PJA72107.1 MAG: 50S